MQAKINARVRWAASFWTALVLSALSGAQPMGAAPFAYVANTDSNTVSVIDTATNSVEATIRVGKAPLAVAVSPDGTRAYVANQNAHTVSVIDTATNKAVATIPAGSFPVGLAVTPDGTHLYVANFSIASHTVSVRWPRMANTLMWRMRCPTRSRRLPRRPTR
jgi:YVTN family beta-propeller protein